MYCIEIIKQPPGSKAISGFISPDAIGIGVKGRKLYKCFSDKQVFNWIESWKMGGTPTSWGFQTYPILIGKEHVIE